MRTTLNGEMFLYSGWNIEISSLQKGSRHPDWKKVVPGIWKELQNPPETLKKDHRSDVGVFRLDGNKYVIKKFVLQNTWFWFQFTSVFFKSLGEIAFERSFRLLESGFQTPEPCLLLQRIKFGAIVESWMVYEFLDGVSLAAEDDVTIVGFVRKLHQAGWIHRDPHPANFIQTSSGEIAMLDPIRALRSNNRYLRAYDVVHMRNDMPSAISIYGTKTLGIWFYLALIGQGLSRSFRSLKHLLRCGLGIRRDL